MQIIPPNLHRTNAAEKAIDIFKDHFISGLATVHPSFPLHLWYRLISLEVTTLNLMRPSRINPKLSAYEILNGVFDCNKNPIAPPGCKVIVHEPPNKRGKWDIHGVDGWYLGMAPDHYRCHRVYIPKMRAEQISQTVKFFPHNRNVPQNTSADVAAAAAHRLIAALRNLAPNAPFLENDKATAAALDRLANIFL